MNDESRCINSSHFHFSKPKVLRCLSEISTYIPMQRRKSMKPRLNNISWKLRHNPRSARQSVLVGKVFCLYLIISRKRNAKW